LPGNSEKEEEHIHLFRGSGKSLPKSRQPKVKAGPPDYRLQIGPTGTKGTGVDNRKSKKE